MGVVIVTGAAGGLGSEMAFQFASAGDNVVVNYSKSESDARNVVSRIEALGKGEPMLYKADVRNYPEVKAMADAAVKKWGSVDVLVNNAGGLPIGTGLPMGTSSRGSMIWEMEDEEWNWLLDTNLMGAFNGMKAVAPQMIKQRDGHIINVSSSYGLAGGAGRSSYCSAKAGMLGLAKSAARELGEFNVRVNTVMPGQIIHERMKGIARPGYAESLGVLRRCQTKEEFSQFVVYLTRTKNISGQLFNLDNIII